MAAASDESGFTLIELLVVMLILGILAAIAIPAFLNQRDKATDSQAKEMVRTMQTTMETCSTDHDGSYGSCDLSALRAIEPTIPSDALAAPGWYGLPYVVSVTSGTGNAFYIYRDTNNKIVRACNVAGSDRGGCQTGDTW